MPETMLPPVVRESRELAVLRDQVRKYLQDKVSSGAFVPGVDTWLTRWDPALTRDLAKHGWVGMTIPKEYGGHGRTFMERFVVTQELLAVGAPVAGQWVADRQVAPALLRFGTEYQRIKYLPEIAAGECSFAIGMSEPDSGSDLASVRTRARQVEGGWCLSGTKVWTSGAHNADAFIVLARSTPVEAGDRHRGLSQFIVDLKADGVEIHPIRSMGGGHHFNEVHLNEVFVPNNLVLGKIGDGWEQVTSELGFERSGPERFMSTFVLWAEALQLSKEVGAHDALTAGRTLARMQGLHHMSMSVAAALQRGDKADTAAAMVKVLGTQLEGDIVENAHLEIDALPPGEQSTRYLDLLSTGLLHRPGFTLRGGTSAILRGVVAREMGMR